MSWERQYRRRIEDNMLKQLLISLRRIPNHARGWRTKRRLVVFESDDWGSIRMPSKRVFEMFLQRGFTIQHARYNQYDSLECNEDLVALYEVLSRHKDRATNPACFTANMIVANPNFEAIQRSSFEEYSYETVQETLGRYPKHDQVFTLYQEGLNANLLRPQFHGREHVQVARWMRRLKMNDLATRFAFDFGTTYSGHEDYNFMESFDWDSPEEVTVHQNIVRDGLRIFKQMFGYNTKSFIAPCYTWDPKLDTVLAEQGVKYVQGGVNQYIPQGGFNNYARKKHLMGERVNGLVYMTRNCFFEPSLVDKLDWVDYAMASIRDAFQWNKPAIICTHRINFVGFIHEVNRVRNLKLLDELLNRILQSWPDVEFISSDQLGDLIAEAGDASEKE